MKRARVAAGAGAQDALLEAEAKCGSVGREGLLMKFICPSKREMKKCPVLGGPLLSMHLLLLDCVGVLSPAGNSHELFKLIQNQAGNPTNCLS